MKILVVDDELVSRKKMQKIMESIGDCEAVETGREAVVLFEKAWMSWAPFDLITLDISMPDMDGTEVLFEVRKREENIPEEKRVKVIMVTSHKDKDSIITCIQAGCNDYVTKPFEKGTLVVKLEKLGLSIDNDNGAGQNPGQTLQGLVDQILEETGAMAGEEQPQKSRQSIITEISKRLQAEEFQLPSYPKVALKYREMVKQGANIDEMAEALKQDPAIAMKLIGVSNTAYYRGMEENKTLEQALKRLGLGVISQYVEAISSQGLFETGNKQHHKYVKRLWEHSLSCAHASKIVTETVGLTLKEDPFLLGLLHDIGKLILIQIIGEFQSEGLLGDNASEAYWLNTLNKLHIPFGAALFGRWKFSKHFTQIAKFHDELDKADSISKELLVVHFSNLLVKSMGYHLFDPDGKVDLEKAVSYGLLKLDPEAVETIKEKVGQSMAELEHVMT